MRRERTGPVLILTLAALCLLAASAFSARLQTSVVSTDQDDYAPYDSVVIMGSGFWPNESIEVQVTHYDGYPPDGEGHEPWIVQADDAGNFETFWIVPPDDHVDEVLLVTATGLSSGVVAQATFTDANTLLVFTTSFPDTVCGGFTFDACANLTQPCGGSPAAPLAGRWVYFWVNTGNCGVDVGQAPDDSALTDAYGNACGELTIPSGPGTFSIRVKFFGEEKPETWEPPNSACDPTVRTKLSSSNQCQVIEIVPGYGTTPTVDLGNDTTITLCDPADICIPLGVDDPECDVDSVVTNIGGYSGNSTDFDQVAKLNGLGGNVVQVGGGDPGRILYQSSDYAPPVNTQSGVAVTLPDFIFADHVTDYGPFPTAPTSNAADYLLGAPTGLTYTLPGAGGPDGGNGDGSVNFSAGNHVGLAFNQMVTTCKGVAVDFVVFTNIDGGGTAEFLFLNGGYIVYGLEEVLPGASAGSGTGGATLDLPDGLMFDEVRITAVSQPFEIDAIAARVINSPSTENVCFWADTAGVYTLTVAVYDGCGHVGYGAVNVTVDLNNPPVADAGPDQSFELCSPSQVCWPASCSDPDGNLSGCALVSGPGTYDGSNICFTPTASGNYSFVLKASDNCGYQDFDTVTVSITMNQPPVAVVPSPITTGLCEPTELCYEFTASDPNGGTLIWSHLAGVGSITGGGHFCFTPTASGSYAATVIVSDSCGLADTVSITYNITLNGAPVFADPASPVNLFQCVAGEVCYQFDATDPDGGNLTFSKLSGDGTVTAAGLFCFTPTAGGAYGVVVAVTDSCGAADTTSLTYNVELNGPPTIVLAGDTTVQLCNPEPICLNYVVADPQGASGLIEDMLSGYGTIDTMANQICFTPTASGSYEFVVAVTDGCGEYDYDTAMVTVNFGQTASIDCPTGPIEVFLCSPDQVCQSLNITPTSATVTVSHGTYSAGQLCFDADTAGTYNITVIAAEDCNADTCTLTFNVGFGAAAQIDCPDPSQEFICAPGDVCIPVGIYGAGATVTVNPIGSYASGSLCFPADTSGHYEITVIAATTCGTDTCLVVSDVTINSAPVAVAPTTPVDTFICAAGQICFQFDASDIDDNISGWTRLSGDGTVTNDGLWCINASGSVTKSVTVAVTDACGAADTTTMTYNVTLNSAPIVTLGGDETRFMCALGPVCVFYDTSDADNNVVSLEELTGIGTINATVGQVCFDPTGEGVYTMILSATDACGAVDLDTVNITVSLNNAPFVDAGEDQTVFQCSAAEICWPVASGDVDGNLASVQMIDGPGTFDGSQVCFTPTGTYNYEFVFQATDICGLETVDTVAVYYTLNTAPVANAGPDQTLFQCTPTEVCLPVSCSDPDGNLSDCALLSGPGYYNGSSICFTPTGSGLYSFVLQATDACGLTDLDTVVANITLNSAPVCVVPNDTSIFLCQSQEVCLPAYGTDVDGNLQVCQIISGPGTLSGGAWCYTPVGHQTVTVTMRCIDACGETCETDFTVNFAVNGAPTVTLGADTTMVLCEAYQICLPYSVSDPDGGRPLTVSLLDGPGTLDEANSRICFVPSVSGIYQFVVGVEDECGLTDSDTIQINLTLNSPPVANAGPDQNLFLCEPTQICWPAACGDPDDNLDQCLFSGPGSYDGTYICFDADTDGEYQFVMITADECGAQDADTAVITITMNTPPTLTMTGDTSLFLCAPQQICLDYNVSDPNASQTVTEVMLSGYGTLDTATNAVCFTPTVGGTYEFVLRATDACGAVSQDTAVVTVSFGQAPVLACPESKDYFLCGPDSVVIPVPVTPTAAAVTTSFGAYANGAVRFFANSEGVYNITVVATTACGADTCHLTGNIDFNEAPIASAGADQSPFLCAPTQICWPASCSDADDNLAACELISPVGSYNGSQICFTPTADGVYEFVLRATDECGAIALDTAAVTVTMNTSPTMTLTGDTSLFLCAPQAICLDYSATDPDAGQTLTEAMVSGYGTLDTAANTACFTPTVGGTYEFVLRATDACGATSEDTATVTVSFGQAPVLTCPGSTDYFLCGPDSIIIPITFSPAGAVITTDAGIYDGGTVRFLADAEGAYDIAIVATTDCGADTCHVTGNIDFNEAPIASAGSDQSPFLCAPTQICWPASCSDADDNLAACELISPVGSYNGSQICFTPTASGVYEFVLRATDDCGEVALDTTVIDVTLNSAPTVTAQADTSLFLCQPTPVCIGYDVADPDAGQAVTEDMGAGFGTIDTLNNQICFTPDASGTFEFIIEVTDPCGETDADTVVVSVTFGQFAAIDCPTEPIDVFLCTADEICQMIDVTPASASVTVSYGTYANGELCFTADTAGTYLVEIVATESCNADTCLVTFNVEIGQAAQIDCPAPASKFLCQPSNICVPVGVQGSGVSVAVSPIGSYSAGSVCFPADTSGHYEIEIIATTDCGIDTCLLVRDVTINSAPVAVDPTSPIDTFMCAAGTVCYQFEASDADNETLTYEKLSGDGTVTADGLWCFNVSRAIAKTVAVVVSDGCNAADTVYLTYNIELNAAPVVTLGNDTSIFVCDGAAICLNYSVTDANDNVVDEVLLEGSGTIDTVLNQFCFTPTAEGAYEFIVMATDACGANDTDTISVQVSIGTTVTVDCAADTSVFFCGPTQFCRPVTVTNASANVTVLPIGSYSSGQVCFDIDTAGHYELTVIADAACGSDTCSFAVDVALNEPPVAVNPEPIDTSLCNPVTVSYQFQADDPESQTLIWSRLSGNGTVGSGGLWSFTPTGSGAYQVCAAVADPCGAADTVCLTYNIDINDAPVVTLGNDTSIFICDGATVCLDYGVTDANDDIVDEVLFEGPGTIDTVNNQFCFTPTAAGSYQFVVMAADACGATDTDTIVVQVSIGAAVTVDCAADTSVFFCGPTQFCRPVTVSNASANVTVLPIGSYSSGQVCFDIDTAGHYELTVIADAACGGDTCSFAVDVALNEPPVAVEPEPIDTSLCDPTDINCQFHADDPEGETLTWSRLSGNGTVGSDGLWTFTPTGSGAYQVCAVATDPCGAADTVCHTVNVTLNSPPTVVFNSKQSMFKCVGEQVCTAYTASDPDNDIVSEVLVEGSGVLDTVANTICFTADTSGTYRFIVEVIDACGATDRDTATYEITINQPPVANLGQDRSLFLCEVESVCWPASVSDPDNNIDSIQIVQGPGTFGGGQFCFTPDTAGTYTFIMRVVDECGAEDRDTALVEINLNSPPICQIPSDTALFQCSPTQVSLPVSASDVDQNFDHCELLAGPGSISAGAWTYTPSTSEEFWVKVMCLDECGESCIDSFHVAFQINSAPTVDAGEDAVYFLCNSDSVICWPVSMIDVDNNLETVELISSFGVYSAGQICFDVPTGARNYQFILKATDECGATGFDTCVVTIRYNQAPTMNLPPDFVAYLDFASEACFSLGVDDADDNLAQVTVAPIGTYDPSADQVCFDADTSGLYCFELAATDACGAETVDSICIEVVIDECTHVQIQKTEDAIQGQVDSVSVFLNGTGKDLGGFDLLIAYDASALGVNSVEPGALFEGCGWEYFNYRTGADGNCGSGCPTGLLRIVGVAETNNGANHPGCFFNGMLGSIADIFFLVSNNRALECQYAPVKFFWLDCGDNAFSSRLGDTLWISRRVYDFEHNPIADWTYGFPGYYGAHDSCMAGGGDGKPAAIRCIDFTDGGIDIICADSIDGRGDINLNEVAYEISDAVLFSNYFVQGLDVFTVNVDGQVAATDVNADGLTLTVADLVYLIRVVIGDAPAVPKLRPGELVEAEFDLRGGLLSIANTDYRIGAVSMIVQGEVVPELAENASHMSIRYSYDGANTRILVYSMNRDGFLEAGDLLNFDGSAEISEIQVGAYDGFVMQPKTNAVPTDFHLSQNYPNPFNPSTTFEFALREATDWKLEVFNILGQKVTSWSGHDDAGWVSLTWNADRQASGVYFYKLEAGDYVATKKMVLLK